MHWCLQLSQKPIDVRVSDALLFKCGYGPANLQVLNSIFFAICSNNVENNKILEVGKKFHSSTLL